MRQYICRPCYPTVKLTLSLANLTRNKVTRWVDFLFQNKDIGLFSIELVLEDSSRSTINIYRVSKKKQGFVFRGSFNI